MGCKGRGQGRRFREDVSALGFPRDEWSKEDWIDFYKGLTACAAKMRARHRNKKGAKEDGLPFSSA